MTVLAVLTPAGPALADPAAPLVRPDDVGLLRGESVFETLRVAGGRAAFVDAHLARLHRSASRLALDVPDGWEALVRTAVEAWAQPDGVLRLVLTRGGVAYAMVTPVTDEVVRGREQGVRAVTLSLGVPAALRGEQHWLLGGVKCTSYAVNMAALREAQARGADDAVLTSSDGEVLEAPTANVLWVTAGTLITPPPAEVGILAGTTADVLLGLSPVPTEVRRGTVAELLEADEVLLASSVRGVAPVVALDGRELPVGPVSAALRAAFEERVREG